VDLQHVLIDLPDQFEVFVADFTIELVAVGICSLLPIMDVPNVSRDVV